MSLPQYQVSYQQKWPPSSGYNLRILALYLAQPRADFLKGSMVGINWDIDRLEQYKDEIIAKKPFQTSWLPILPFNGGKGLGGLSETKGRRKSARYVHI